MSMILEQLINAGPVAFRGQLAQQVDAVVAETSNQLVRFNTTTDQTVRLSAMQHILGYSLPAETVINPPFQTDFGPHTKLGRHVFINRDCLFVDLGGITIDDDALIGPRVSLISVNHQEDPAHRRDLELKSVHIEHGAWLGAGVTVLPGVTIGHDAIVGAGAVVTKDVPPRMVVAGVPAKIIRPIQATDQD